jgi:methylenetetrahydrofolate reductase (NADPH)
MSLSRFEERLRSGRFCVTAELSPRDSADPEVILAPARTLAGVVTAMNVPDSTGANVHISPLACSIMLHQAGIEPIMQLGCRDRNRIALQGDLLGAAASGVRNVFLITGDDTSVGNQSDAKRVFDLDSAQLLHTAEIMCDRGQLLNGTRLAPPASFFIGAAANPFVPPYDWRPHRMGKKVDAGARFIQTQYCFDVPRFVTFMQKVRDLGLHERAYILVGVGPLPSARVADIIRTRVPGVVIPDVVVERMAGVPKEAQEEEGMGICLEIIEQVREIKGVSGVHLMAHRREDLVAETVRRAGLQDE